MKVVHKEFMDNITYNISGLTYEPMICFYGAPVHDSVTFSEVTTSPISIDIIMSWDIKARILQGAESFTFKVSNLSNVDHAPAVVTEQSDVETNVTVY